MSQNQASKDLTQFLMNDSTTQNSDNKRYQQLQDANPLQKKQLRKPLSIFPLIKLPDFKYSQNLIDLSSQINNNQKRSSRYSPDKTIRSRTISPYKNSRKTAKQIYGKQLFQLHQNQLKNLFVSPIYKFNRRLSLGSNKNFANLQVFYEQSQDHKQIIENINAQQKSDQNLQFQSRFQSGNLAFATKYPSQKNSYLLLLHKDLNTARCTQWFFFRVKNKLQTLATLHILNFFKSYSSYEYGMKICVCSKSNGYTWTRGGEQIKYRKTNLKCGKSQMYALSFTYKFQSPDDETYFAYCYPYTYSKLDKLLFTLEQKHAKIMKRKTIGYSLGGRIGNVVDMVTITNFKPSSTNLKSEDKRLIVLSARVHPGETPSSFVMEGIINKLLQNTDQIQNLRDRFIFKLVPMINPDGVINGNYRCSLSGYDLNRVWHKASKTQFPQIYCIVKSIEQANKKPFLFVDLHAHSKKKGAFMYGCANKSNPYACRQLPFLLWKSISQFNYYQCNFSLNKGRQGTGRMFAYKGLGIANSYTMEHSFCGPSKVKVHFNANCYIAIGQGVVFTLEKFYSGKKKLSSSSTDIDQSLLELYENKQLLKVGQTDINDSSDDSELDEQFQVQVQPQPKQKQEKKQWKISKERPRSKIIMTERYNSTVSPSRNSRARMNMVESKTADIKEKYQSEIKLFPQKIKPSLRQMPKVGLNLDDFQRQSQQRYLPEYSQMPLERECFSSFQKKQEQFKSKKFLKSVNRYCDQDVNNLTNLFLPSVTSSSYKKYAKSKNPTKGSVLIGKKFLETAGILKEQIRSSCKRKPQSSGKTFL